MITPVSDIAKGLALRFGTTAQTAAHAATTSLSRLATKTSTQLKSTFGNLPVNKQETAAPVWLEILGFIEKDGQDYGVTNTELARQIAELTEDHADDVATLKLHHSHELAAMLRTSSALQTKLTIKHGIVYRAHAALRTKLAVAEHRSADQKAAIQRLAAACEQRKREAAHTLSIVGAQLAEIDELKAQIAQKNTALDAAHAEADVYRLRAENAEVERFLREHDAARQRDAAAEANELAEHLADDAAHERDALRVANRRLELELEKVTDERNYAADAAVRYYVKLQRANEAVHRTEDKNNQLLAQLHAVFGERERLERELRATREQCGLLMRGRFLQSVGNADGEDADQAAGLSACNWSECRSDDDVSTLNLEN